MSKLVQFKGKLQIVAVILVLLVVTACGGGNSANQGNQGSQGSQGGQASSGSDAGKKEAPSAKLPRDIVIATDKAGGASNNMTNGLASIITESTGIKTTVKGLGNLKTYINQFKAGEIDFALHAGNDPIFAYYGLNEFEEKNDFIRMVSVGANQTWSILVPNKYDDIRTVEQLKSWLPGKTMSHGWVNPIIDLYNRAAFANLGLTENDIKAFPVSNYDDYGAAWAEGRMDATGATIGAGILQQMYSATPFHFVSLDDSPEALERMKQVEPSLYISKQPAGSMGIDEELNVLTYDYVLVARSDIDDAVIQAVLNALYDNQEKIATLPNLEKWGPADQKWVSERASLPYHPGAIEFFKDKGLWKSEMDAVQEKWLAGERF